MEHVEVSEVRRRLGSPLEKWSSLRSRVQDERVLRFQDTASEFLDLLWCLDQHRVQNVPPAGVGLQLASDDQRLDAAVRMKGGWFATLLTLLLENQVSSPLAPRSQVQGFSQTHQIDIAWPAKQPIPLVCVETKVMGGPPYKRYSARAATADWSNRRKELKFQATDLKLFRRQQATRIDHWDNWRKSAPPFVYFIWCARMKPGADRLDRMIKELRALTDTYLDGAAVFAYHESSTGSSYEVVPIPWADRVVDLDDQIHRIANQINDLPPKGVELEAEDTVVRVDQLAAD